MLNTVHTKIVSTLNELVGSGLPLSIVYSDPLDANESISSYPAVIVALSDFNNEYITSAENKIGMNFSLYLVQEVENAGITKANRILRQTIDDIIVKFAQDWDQGVTTEGHRIWWNINVGSSNYDVEEKKLYYQISLNINLIYDIN